MPGRNRRYRSHKKSALIKLLRAAAVASSFAVPFSCGADTPTTHSENGKHIPNYQLTVTETYGVETGDSLNMIGSINDFCYHPDGSILVMDQAALRIRRIQNGEITLISREGSGPGEFNLPTSICCMENGTILIGDEGNREVMQFSSQGEYEEPFFITDRYGPRRMFPTGSDSFTGVLYDLQFQENSALFTIYFGRFEADPMPVLVFDSKQFEVPDPVAYTKLFAMDYTGAPDGSFCIALDNTQYSISIYSPDGDLVASINQPNVTCIPKSQEEIADEITEFERFAVNDQSYTGGYQPCPYHTLISLAGVDASGNLWIRRHDAETGCIFDVWDLSGNLVHTVSYQHDGSADGILFHVDQYGVLAGITDEESFPQVLVLELESLE